MSEHTFRPLSLSLTIGEKGGGDYDGGGRVNSAPDVYALVSPLFSDLSKSDREMFIILHLDPKNNVIDRELSGLGDTDSSAVYPRQVYRSAVVRGASALIFVHNHPSGDPEPSLSDRELTKTLVYCGTLVGIKVLDHIIIGEGRYYSFADRGLIDEYFSQSPAFCVGG